MLSDRRSTKLAQFVTPRALKTYAQALGWKPVAGVNGSIAVFVHPSDGLRQIIVPTDESFDDYADGVAEAIRRLAEFEHRETDEILNHLLLPPADVLRFRESSPDTETGSVHLEQAVNLLDGTRRLLLSMAHSVLKPQPYHPRLSRSEAESFIQNCRLGQTEYGSFTFTLACPLDFVPGTLFTDEPFARQIVAGVLSSMHSIAKAADSSSLDELVDSNRHPYLSANFCEALSMLRPGGDRSRLFISVAWSKALTAPQTNEVPSSIEVRQEFFEAVEYLAPRLRAAPQPKLETFVGFVDVLKGDAGPDGRMQGEVVFTVVLIGDEVLKARAELDANDYQTAGDAHLKHQPVYFRGFLIRAPRTNRIENISEFKRLVSGDSPPVVETEPRV